jgi:hypothetical protein
MKSCLAEWENDWKCVASAFGTRPCRMFEVLIWGTFCAAMYWPSEWTQYLNKDTCHFQTSRKLYLNRTWRIVVGMSDTWTPVVVCRQVCGRTSGQNCSNLFESSHEDAERLLMEETVSGTMDNNATLTRLVAHEGFIAHSCHESFKSYVMNLLQVSNWSA